MSKSFETLVALAKEKNKEAAGEVIDLLKPMIWSTIKREGTGLEREDLFQELCLTALECIHTYDSLRSVPFLAYVKKAMQYKVWSMKRSQRWHFSLDVEDECGVAFKDSLKDPLGNAEELIFKRFESERLRNALDTLSPKQKQVVLAYYVKREKLKDLAESKRKHPKGIMSLKKRGLKALREKLE